MAPSATPSVHSASSSTDIPNNQVRGVMSKTKLKAKATLSLDPDASASKVSLHSNGKAPEDARPNTASSSKTNLLDKLKQKREARKERKAREKELGHADTGSNAGKSTDDEEEDRIRRPSATESEASIATYNSDDDDENEPISNAGYLTLSNEPPRKPSTSFPVTVSTSVEDPAKTPKPPLYLTTDQSSRRATSPNLGSNSRDPSPTPSLTQTAGASSSNLLLGGFFGKKRSDSTVSKNTDVSKDNTEAHLERETPESTPVKALGNSPRPETTVTPPTPIDGTTPTNTPTKSTTTSPAGGSLSQRRGRTGSLGQMPSKLSQTQYADDRASKPLTPTIEVPTPAATPAIGGNTGGFFSSMFTAAQSAATQLSNTIANTSLAPGQAGTGGKNKTKGENISPGTSVGPTTPTQELEKELGAAATAEKELKRLAVETLGHGELNLASLGITLEDSKDTASIRGRRPGSRGTSNGETDPDSVSGVVPLARQVGLGVYNGNRYDADDVFGPGTGTGHIQEKFYAENDVDDKLHPGGFSPPPQLHDEENIFDGRRRSGSVRSALGRAGSRRKRGSSAATTTTAATNAAAAVPSSTTPRPSGFAVATQKRNKDFHSLFRSVPEDDYLIEDYGCALQKEILLQGRIYVSEGHICFNSNIFGWVTTLIISFDEVVSIEKKSTAVVFPNAIVIQTLHARNVFASFISRDSSYDLLVGIWRMSHPALRTSTNGVRLDDGEHGTDSDEELSEEEEEDEDFDAASTAGTTSEVANDVAVSKPKKFAAAGSPEVVITANDIPGGSYPFPGPVTHTATTCGDEAAHYDKALCDETLAAPLGKIFALVFGDMSYPWLQKFLVEEVKILELQIPENGVFAPNPEHAGKKTRSYSYIKPLNGSIGPRQTKCLITEIVEQEDFDKAVTILVETRTPDVPNGAMFKVMTRYCLMWAEGGNTRLVMNCTIEWSGKSWIKGPIEKGASEGQTAFTKDFIANLKREFTPKNASAVSRGLAGGNAGKGNGGKKRRKGTGADGATSSDQITTTTTTTSSTANSNTSNSAFGPLGTYLIEPLSSVLGNLLGGVVSALVVLVGVYVLYRLLYRNSASGATTASRRAIERMEEMWMQEEDNLWEWMKDRSGVSDIYGLGDDAGILPKGGVRMMSDGMKEREMDDLIRVTEERLQSLKKVLKERRGGG